uniref:carnosine N-methyltransferase n=1 Tax=Caenorhabditis tropicalis TaxID=1561998 RepID=A0A1I7UUG7_9PELO
MSRTQLKEEKHDIREESHEQEDEDVKNGMDNDEVRAIEEVINALNYYGKFGTEKILGMIKQMRNYPPDFQAVVLENNKEFIASIKERIEHNHSILKMIASNAAGVAGEKYAKAVRIHQTRRPTGEFLSKVLSTIRQICREWSSEGLPEREATFRPIIEELNSIFPNETERHKIQILVPGCGLGRLAHDLIENGYTVQGNEFSYFMLFTSFFILNACKEADQFTIYPYLFEKNNCWKPEDRLRGVTFPDKKLASTMANRPNCFSMCAGDFLEIVKNEQFDAIVTAWFIDTAHDIFQYIDAIYSALPDNGIWINVGPLTWHYEGVAGETSIELSYSEIMLRVRQKGFEVLKEAQIDSKYTVNRLSMLQNQFTCGYFYARKAAKQQ